MVVAGGGAFYSIMKWMTLASSPEVPTNLGSLVEKPIASNREKRMLSSMSPTIVSKDGTLYAVVRYSGGSTIITANLQTIANLIDFNMSMEEVGARSQDAQSMAFPKFILKNKFDQSVILQLEKWAYTSSREVNALGKLDCIKVLEVGSLEGGTDHKRRWNNRWILTPKWVYP